MTTTRSLADTVMPSAVMTEEEIAAWNSLDEAEQLRRLEILFQQNDCQTMSDLTFDEVMEGARARLKAGSL